MQTESRNPYKSCRKIAGITQEKAAEMLGVSVESLRDYEGDRTKVPGDIVLTMTEIYNAPYLGNQHLRYSSVVGESVLPEIHLKELPEAVLSVLAAVQKFVAKRDALIDITADGKITAEEQSEWNEILASVDALQAALVSMKFSKGGR